MPAARIAVEQLVGEVETGGRRRHRAGVGGVDRLVGRRGRRPRRRRALDVGRQRRLAETIEPLEVEGRVEADAATAPPPSASLRHHCAAV